MLPCVLEGQMKLLAAAYKLLGRVAKAHMPTAGAGAPLVVDLADVVSSHDVVSYHLANLLVAKAHMLAAGACEMLVYSVALCALVVPSHCTKRIVAKGAHASRGRVLSAC